MSDKIKLENIVRGRKEAKHEHPCSRLARFCPECGEDLTEEVITTEYVCSGCRHLVGADEKFCPSCGEPLVASGNVEHYGRKDQLISEAEFQVKKKLLRRV